MSLKLSIIRGDIDQDKYNENLRNLHKLPESIKNTFKLENEIQLMAKEFLDAKGSMFLGRGNSFPIALEGALKLLELSYLHAEGYAAGDM